MNRRVINLLALGLWLMWLWFGLFLADISVGAVFALLAYICLGTGALIFVLFGDR
jgi:hypothetical protein